MLCSAKLFDLVSGTVFVVALCGEAKLITSNDKVHFIPWLSTMESVTNFKKKILKRKPICIQLYMFMQDTVM